MTMTLTVRLDTMIAAALDRYCVDRGATKSLVVQECLAHYLLSGHAQSAQTGAAAAARPGTQVSSNYLAFADAGLVGAGVLGGVSADKAAVRARAMLRLRGAAL